ncbi:MAG TPA: hypothetical protein VI259_04965 [Gemmatimonadaceae bacterium]
MIHVDRQLPITPSEFVTRGVLGGKAARQARGGPVVYGRENDGAGRARRSPLGRIDAGRYATVSAGNSGAELVRASAALPAQAPIHVQAW